MTIQQVQYVLEIARCGSISRAAAALYLSQPALSAQVRALEQELDCRLFRRSARGVEPTEAGVRFCRWAEPAAQAWTELRQRCGELKNVPYETIRIGFDVRAQSNGLTRPVLDYFDRRPSTELSFITDMYQNALEALAEKRLDLAICRLPPQPLPPAAEELTITPLLTERQCILMSPEAAGESRAMVRAIGPQPQPRSRKVPSSGGSGTESRSTAVPLSRPPGENTPPATDTVTARPARSRSRRMARSDAATRS